MKRLTKILLVLTGFFLILGLGLVLAGVAMGADWNMVREAGSSLPWGDFDFDFDHNEWHHEDGQEEWSGDGITHTFTAEDIQELDIELRYGELVLRYSDEADKIGVEVSSDHVTVSQDAGDKKLKIQGKHASRLSGTQNVVITYPAGKEFREAEIELDAGTVELEDDFQADELDVKVAAGELSAYGAIQAKKSSWSVGAGSVCLDYLDSKKVELECDMGELEATLAGSETDYDYEVECGMGEITIGDNSYGGISRKQKVDNHGARKLEAECGMGEIILNFEI